MLKELKGLGLDDDIRAIYGEPVSADTATSAGVIQDQETNFQDKVVPAVPDEGTEAEVVPVPLIMNRKISIPNDNKIKSINEVEKFLEVKKLHPIKSIQEVKSIKEVKSLQHVQDHIAKRFIRVSKSWLKGNSLYQ